MYIRCWGARGSIPVSGPEYLQYGGDTTCLEIRTAARDAVVIVDAGTGLRPLANRLLAEGRRDYTFLFTHAHWDHILGFPFFKPLYSPHAGIRIFGCSAAQGDMHKLLARTMSTPYFPVPFAEVRAEVEYREHCGSPLVLDGMRIETIPLSHPNGGVGFRFTEGERSFVFLTDNEPGYAHPGARDFEDYVRFCAGADILLHDAEYTEEEYARRRGWGHCTVERAVDLAVSAGVRALGLFHHNQDRSDDAVERMVELGRERCGKRGGPSCFGVAQGWSATL